jgi:capsular polysaccharide biosynthesis protein
MLTAILERMIQNQGIILTYWEFYLAMFNTHNASVPDRSKYTMSMMNSNSNNYYHWTIEHLARLRGIYDHPDLESDSVELLLRPTAPQYVKESLNILGFHSYKLYESDHKLIPKLLVPSHTFRSRNHEFGIAPSDLKWVRDKMLDDDNKSDKSYEQERIYISRKDAKNGREVTNVTELNTILDRFNFKKYVLSDLSVLDQISLFSNAEIVLGPHGAGFANILYSSKTTSVIELYGDDLSQGKFFFLLANELDLDYYNIHCQTDSDGGIYLPIEKLNETLSNIL